MSGMRRDGAKMLSGLVLRHAIGLIALYMMALIAPSFAFASPADYVVRVTVRDEAGAYDVSGVLVAQGRVATAARALGGADAEALTVTYLSGGAPIRVARIQRDGDVALLSFADPGVGRPPAIAVTAAQTNEAVIAAWATSAGVGGGRYVLTWSEPPSFGEPIRGAAVGGAILNSCSQVIGLILPGRASTAAEIRRAAAPNSAGLSTIGLAGEALQEVLRGLGAPLAPAPVPCESPAPPGETVAELAVAEAQAQAEVQRLQQALARAERQRTNEVGRIREELTQATTRLEETSAQLEEAEDQALGAQAQAQQATQQTAVVSTENAKIRTYARYGALGAAALLLVLAGVAGFLVWRARRRSKSLERDLDSLAEQDRARANAPDWVLTGKAGRMKLRGALMADAKRGSIVGRGKSEADVLIDAEQISRKHARFSLRDGGVFIEDLRSTNGTSVNGRKLAAGEVTEVREGDKIDFADQSYVLQRV
ncbi:MAG: FHA domain-containing protein [Alphaproteobacteria bacterium]|nr:FHA domain-containing protein [Alphaproteobacteria bacterium]